MGHLGAKHAFDRLADRLDRMPVRAPHTPELQAILSELYTPEEAGVVGSMLAAPTPISGVARATGLPPETLRPLLARLCEKGLVLDLWSERRADYLYAPSPFVIGVFEFTLMRAAPAADHRRRAGLFREYWDAFLRANFGAGQRVSIARALPHEPALPEAAVEVLDHERASELIRGARTFAVGTCSCRHEKQHLGEKRCAVPLESCTALDAAADYLIRNGLAREISRAEMSELVERSRELGLVMSADNVQKDVKFICHCCACCCNLLLGITRYGYPNTVVSSSYTARVDATRCDACGRCARTCPVGAVSVQPARRVGVDAQRCLGCGVCVTRCTRGALGLERTRRRVLHPETMLERAILMALERGTLESLVFDGKNSGAAAFLRALVGGFLRLGPVQQALMSDALRSSFLRSLRVMARAGSGGDAEA